MNPTAAFVIDELFCFVFSMKHSKMHDYKKYLKNYSADAHIFKQ